jgi:hypothetical protein
VASECVSPLPARTGRQKLARYIKRLELLSAAIQKIILERATRKIKSFYVKAKMTETQNKK